MRVGSFIIFFILIETCGAQSLKNWSEIVFQSQARSGAFQEIRLSQDSVFYRFGNLRSGNMEKGQKCLDKKTRRNVQQILRPLENIDWSSLESPTNKRAYDGASHSQLSLKTDNNQFDHYFDDESPHEKLTPLLTLILGLKEE